MSTELLPPPRDRAGSEPVVWHGRVLHLQWDPMPRLYVVRDAGGEVLLTLDVQTYDEARGLLVQMLDQELDKRLKGHQTGPHLNHLMEG